MADSLFLSPGFILVEFSFIIVASIAAYELLVGDFIWAQQEEARRTSMQSNRGRGYDSFESRQLQLHGHRSLSPGGRGRGSRSAPGSRRGSAEDAPNFPSRSRGVNRFTEESTIPDHPRFASPGRGSSGDSTRRLFYKFILIALLSRFILFPVETYCLSQTYNSSTLSYDPSLLRIMLRISQTLPDIAFASALGLLVIFCATIAFAAMPPLTPDLSEGSMHGPDDAETIEDGISERTGLLGEGAVKGQENIEGKDATNRLKRNSKMAFSLCIAAARLPRTVLASRKTFSTWNIILSISYTLIFFTALVIPHCPLSMCEISLWILIATIYSFLLLALIYVAALLGKTLHPGIVSQKNSYSLALRLVGTCTLLAIMFIDRVACFGMVAHHAIINLDGSDHEERIRSSYRRSAIEYAISESLPVLFILFMMHRKRKEVHNDVIIHSIMNNLFGSTGFLGASESSQLDTTNTSSAPADGTGSATARGGLGGSRRFQTYGGTRGDSFPAPSSSAGNKPRRNIPRATSSSGGGRPKQHHGNATDALALENGSKKGGLKPYGPVRSLVTRDDR
mmetsp:Transcript_14681/g.31903  ORF Transcript_14681/g.31903 Transcript_14681/m.31903 type:complete len:566 (-) Transcript_14681:321-2018(-)|eukprot:CAMPEP_0172318248 /NCGR_PEP_ID=MMETSP1058-20130122/34289_1 /TAXON_ID=83371 /ORGANISM="Detonula confervacea, Strain CCMP 353" /LENGTH=565 /DNA_ID=CAMNT_0013033019 /DNA_START=142 /DNA_END=1839 /DNA_ORIENTATION=+